MLDRRLAKFQLSLVRSNWSPFWTQAQRFLLPAQPPFLLFFPRPITPHSGSSEQPPEKTGRGTRDSVSSGQRTLWNGLACFGIQSMRKPSGSLALEIKASGNPPNKDLGRPHKSFAVSNLQAPSTTARSLVAVLEITCGRSRRSCRLPFQFETN